MGSKLKWRIDMGSKDKEKSLLEIAIELLDMKKKPQKITAILKEVMEIKGD